MQGAAAAGPCWRLHACNFAFSASSVAPERRRCTPLPQAALFVHLQHGAGLVALDRAFPLSTERVVRDARIMHMADRHMLVADSMDSGSVQPPEAGLQLVVSWADYVRGGGTAVDGEGRVRKRVVRLMCAAVGYIMPWAVTGRFAALSAEQGAMCMLY